MSLGYCTAGHSLVHRLDVAHKYGYQGIEVFQQDVVSLGADAGSTPFNMIPSASDELKAARKIRRMCTERGLEVICLQPFRNYEGLVDRSEHEQRLKEIDLWIQIAHALDTDLIHIPSNVLPSDLVTEDVHLIASDLRKLADIGSQAIPPLRFSYESLAWGTRINTWEQCWDLVQRVNKPNFGICLDTFNIAARIYADPTDPSGRRPEADDALRISTSRLAKLDVAKVFYVQVVDAERLAEPLVEGHPLYRPDQPPLLSWSRNCRLFYGESDRGAYLPIKEIATAIFGREGIGFQGWVSLELFNSSMSNPRVDIPEELARRGAISWAKLVRDMKLKWTKGRPKTDNERLSALL